MSGIDQEYWWYVALVDDVELDVFAPSSSITRLRDSHIQRLGYTGPGQLCAFWQVKIYLQN
jgi:hypothetical protein